MQIEVFDLGLVDFARTWQFQKELLKGVKVGYLDAALIFCQHYPVITLGRLADKKNILVSEEELAGKGIEKYEIERGGDVTYHGPGQLMFYPILNLNYFKKDINLYLRQLEELPIELLSDFKIRAIRKPGFTGVWIDKQKIASVGVAIKNWITLHGISLNVKKDDLENFSLIRPCGLEIQMTSLETVLGKEVQIDYLKAGLLQEFRRIFNIAEPLVPKALQKRRGLDDESSLTRIRRRD